MREGGWDTLRQVAFIVFVGSVITNLVCFIIWPTSATANLRANFKKTLDSFAVVLELVTRDFIDDDDISSARLQPEASFTSIERRQFTHEELKKAVDAHQASFTGLKRSLDEARMEWLSSTTSSSGVPSPRYNAATAYEDAVNCMNRLAQHLNGLRSSAGLQDEMTAIARSSKDKRDPDDIVTHVSSRNLSRWSGTDSHYRSSTSNNQVNGSNKGKSVDSVSITVRQVEPDTMHGQIQKAKADNDVFEELVDELGPSVTALSVSRIMNQYSTYPFSQNLHIFLESMHECPLPPPRHIRNQHLQHNEWQKPSFRKRSHRPSRIRRPRRRHRTRTVHLREHVQSCSNAIL